MRLDPDRFAYLQVADTPLVARAARIDGDTIRLALSDGSEEVLDPGTLKVDAAGTLRCRVREGRLGARLATSAAVELARLVDDDGAGPALTLGGRRYSLSAS